MGTTEHRRKPWRMLPLLLLALLAFIPFDAFAWDATQSSTAATASSITTTATTLPPTNCSECHGGSTIENHHSTQYFLNGECNHCHQGVTVTGDCSLCHNFGLQNNHHQSAPALAGNCSQCHANVGDYKNCLSCHLGKTRTRHHQIAATGFACNSCHSSIVATGSCRDCHTTPVRQRHHTVAKEQSRSCVSCHTQMVDTAGGCKSCHNFQDPTKVNVHHTAAVEPYGMTCYSCHPFLWDESTSSFKTGFPGAAECTSCHTTVVGTASIVDTHHMTLAFQNNECATCHQGVTPVPDCSGCHSTAGGAIATRHHATDLATQGACVTCHTGAEAQKIVCANCHSNPPTICSPRRMPATASSATAPFRISVPAAAAAIRRL